jgi:hypothetical protein
MEKITYKNLKKILMKVNYEHKTCHCWTLFHQEGYPRVSEVLL